MGKRPASKVATIRLTNEALRAIRSAAKKEGLTLSAFIARAAEKEAAKISHCPTCGHNHESKAA